MIKNIIFDFDGVLVDSETIVLKAFSKYMQECRIKTNEKELANLVAVSYTHLTLPTSDLV